jgi:Calcineurin-like phosphoesterase
MPSSPRERFAMSDVHGHLAAFATTLRAHGVIRADGKWAAEGAELWILGDYLDRGDDGLAVVDAVRTLQSEAAAADGAAHALLGNHELQFLAALYFGDREISGDGETSFLANWRRYGGRDEELAAVTDEQVAWMSGLPLLGVSDGDLLMHSDTRAYLELGRTVDEINAAGRSILKGRDGSGWAELHRIMTLRGELVRPEPRAELLESLNAQRIVHGHSTLRAGFGLSGLSAAQPFSYGDGTVLAIDGGVFEDGGHLLFTRL